MGPASAAVEWLPEKPGTVGGEMKSGLVLGLKLGSGSENGVEEEESGILRLIGSFDFGEGVVTDKGWGGGNGVWTGVESMASQGLVFGLCVSVWGWVKSKELRTLVLVGTKAIGNNSC